jgi:pyridoxamine 5'-phosphate oxidase
MDNEQYQKDLQKKYSSEALIEETVNKNPFTQFILWYDEALNSGIPDANAMILATASQIGLPSVRTVLLKGYNEKGFVFYTNYESDKAKDLTENPYAALLFLWKELARQIRISGRVEKTTPEESEAYFRTRPAGHQISAWASEQSKTIPNRDYLVKEFNRIQKQFDWKEIPLPPNWGGYRVIPTEFEFWQGRENRLHDRICYTKKGKAWQISRLSP